MQAGKKHGMQTMNDALYQLYMAREVTEEDCLRVSADHNEFYRLIGKTVVEGDAASKESGAKPHSGPGTRR
jgi:twitching motility protein PilT